MLQAVPAVISPSAEERAYLEAVGEVHRHVRIDGSRLGMSGIMYSICDIDAETLGDRLAAIRTDLDQAAAVLASLAVPTRFEAVQRNYAQVLRLYQQGIAEMDRTTQDDDPQHLRDAFPFTNSASEGLATLESLVWAPPAPEVEEPTGPGATLASARD
jgi:hypothetical protein